MSATLDDTVTPVETTVTFDVSTVNMTDESRICRMVHAIPSGDSITATMDNTTVPTNLRVSTGANHEKFGIFQYLCEKTSANAIVNTDDNSLIDVTVDRKPLYMGDSVQPHGKLNEVTGTPADEVYLVEDTDGLVPKLENAFKVMNVAVSTTGTGATAVDTVTLTLKPNSSVTSAAAFATSLNTGTWKMYRRNIMGHDSGLHGTAGTDAWSIANTDARASYTQASDADTITFAQAHNAMYTDSLIETGSLVFKLRTRAKILQRRHNPD